MLTSLTESGWWCLRGIHPAQQGSQKFITVITSMHVLKHYGVFALEACHITGATACMDAQIIIRRESKTDLRLLECPEWAAL